MLRHGARAVPWARVVLAAGLVIALMELVRWNPWALWPLQGTGVGLLAGATAWCFDETAAAVVDTAPRGLAWRTGARSPAVLLLALAWVFGVLRVGDHAAFGHLEAILVQGLVGIACGAAFACWRRAQGAATPGLRFATAVVPVVTTWALLRPFHDHLEVFPYATTSAHGWKVSLLAWTAVGLAAILALLAAVADEPWWHLHRQPTTPMPVVQHGTPWPGSPTREDCHPGADVDR